ncbi:MAG: hypothetical protein ACR5KW_03590 [Wolbachia sp.]
MIVLIFFTIAITALLVTVISKNNTISEKDNQLTNQEKEIEGKILKFLAWKERLDEKRNRLFKLENEIDELKNS